MNCSTKMAPSPHAHHLIFHGLPMEPVSRTYQYRKIMKPMLERKRRARINKCLDELKDLMTSTLQADGENLSKLEKADILELTVRHLHRLRETNGLFVRPTETLNMEKFWAGFQRCAVEVSQFLQKYDHQNKNINRDLIKYIANYVPNMAATIAAAAATTNATHPTTHMPNTPLAMNTPGCAANPMANNINEHYQRFSTALRDMPTLVGRRATNITKTPPPPSSTANLAATLNVNQQQMQISASAVSNFELIWEAATRSASATGATRMHPYARKATLAKHCNGASDKVVDVSGDDSSCSSDGTNGDFSSTDGIVWRPW